MTKTEARIRESTIVITGLPLFDFAYCRRTDPDTSRDAARRVDMTAGEQRVMDALRRWGPQTSYEVADRLGVGVEKISARFKPLERKGRIERTGERREGRAVWELVR